MKRSIAFRTAAFAGVWWLLTGGALSSWLIGVPAVAVAAALSWRLRGAGGVSVSLKGVAGFGGFFLIESFRGGFDVARRALARRVDVQPGFLVYRTDLPPGLPRLFLSSSVSLLPGTLTVDLEDDDLVIHALTLEPDPVPGIAACESRIRNALVATPHAGGPAARHA